jgi:hypothetical protein
LLKEYRGTYSDDYFLGIKKLKGKGADEKSFKKILYGPFLLTDLQHP